MNANQMTCQQLQQRLFDELKNLYKRELDRELSHITCRVFEKTLVILMEGTITQAEQILADNHKKHLAKKVRQTLDRVIQPQIKSIIEQVLNLKVIDFLSDTTLDNNCTGAIVIFELENCAENPLNLTNLTGVESQKLALNGDATPGLNLSTNKA